MIDDNEKNSTSSEEHQFNLHVGQKLRQRRLMLGLTQTELAEKIGLTFQQVQKYERGHNRVSAGRLLELAGVMNIPISFFYQGLPTPDKTMLSGFTDGGQEALEDEASKAESSQVSRETDELLRAYYRIADARKRKGVLDFIRAMAGDDDDSENNAA